MNKSEEVQDSETNVLSIAIPTYNRAKTLDESLSRLLPQVEACKEKIQIVISDNASTDETENVVHKYKLKFHDVNIIYYKQKENTGFYGNFLKVKELSTGYFIWMLSDDDHVDLNFIDYLLKVLEANRDVGIVFLKDWQAKDVKYSADIITIDELFIKFSYRLTLISSLVYRNNKHNDEYIARRFINSNFIGFIFIIYIASLYQKAVVIGGKSINVGKDIPKGYNWFQAFIIDINEALKYMKELGFKLSIVKNIHKQIFKKLILYRYSFLKAYGKLDGGLEHWDLRKVNSLIFEYYINGLSYLLKFSPLYLTPSPIIRLKFGIIGFLKSIYRKFRKKN